MQIEMNEQQKNLVKQAQKLIAANHIFSEDLEKAVNTLEYSKTVSVLAFEFAVDILRDTVQDARYFKGERC
jgi:ubiquinone biosynthesis protein COQ9